METTSAESGSSQHPQTQLELCQREVEDLRQALAVAQEQLKAAQEQSLQYQQSNTQAPECVSQSLQYQDLRTGSPTIDAIAQTSADVANALLTIANFGEAVNTALQIIGEALNTDRINVIENVDLASDSAFPGWRALEYEWNSPGTLLQSAHDSAGQGSYEEIQWLYELLRQGQPASYLIEEAPEPFRSAQMAIGVKATHIVPIYVEGRWWGVFGMDDCFEAKRRSGAELAVLRIAADCIGSAIQRERTQQALLKAEQERSQELERINAELQQTLSRLTDSEQRYRQILELACEGIYRYEYEEPISLHLPVEEQIQRAYQYRTQEHNLAYAHMYGYDQPDALVGVRLIELHDSSAPENDTQMRQYIEAGHQMRNLETVEIDRFGRRKHFLNNAVAIIKDGCAIGGWATQIDITELREAQQALLKAEQTRVAELAKANSELQQRDRLLEATATAANVLSTLTNFDKAVNTALQIIGETIDTDRIAVLENFDVPSERLPYWRVLYEWDAAHIPSQLAHPDATQGRWADIEEWYEQFIQGQGGSYLLEEMPEALRVDLKKVGVKTATIVPIFVEGQFWGVLGFDDCREVKQRSAAELSALKIAADCIGSSIERERTQQALLQAEQVRTRNAAKYSQELKRHNIELQQTLDRLAESEKRYRTLFELSSEGIVRWEYKQPIPITLSVDEQLDLCYQSIRIAEVNNALAEMYGYQKAEDLIGLTPREFHDRGSDITQTAMRAWIQNHYSCQSLETEEIDRQGRKRYFLNSAVSTIEHDCVTSTWISQVDVSELRETQQALLQAEQVRVAELAKANDELLQRDRLLSTVAAIMKDLLENPQTEVAIAQALQRIGEATGISRIGLLQEKTDPKDGRLQHQVIQEWSIPGMQQQSDDSSTSVIYNEDYGHFSDDLHAGRSIWYSLEDLPEPARTQEAGLGVKSTGAAPIFIEGNYFGCVSFDDCVTYRQWTAYEIDMLTSGAGAIGAALHRQQLVDRLVAAVLEERSRFARDIHDTLAQAFTGVLMQLEASKRKITTSQFDAAQDHIARARSLALEGLSEARRSVRALRPEVLESLDLPTALHCLAEQTTADTDLAVTVRIEGTPHALPPDVETNLLRIGQEALTNALRHAHAQTIRLELLFESDAVHLCVRDNGQGFNPQSQLINGGFGLIGMQERSQRLGGQLRLNSSPGGGTVITVTVPFQPEIEGKTSL